MCDATSAVVVGILKMTEMSTMLSDRLARSIVSSILRRFRLGVPSPTDFTTRIASFVTRRPSSMCGCCLGDDRDGPPTTDPHAASFSNRRLDAYARRGQVLKMKLCHHLLCARYTSRTMWWAAWANRLDVVKYLHERGCEWTWETTAYAAERGNYKVLKYAMESGCPTNHTTTLYAAKGGDLGCLIYAIDHGVPVGRATLRECADAECVYYALTKGCPLPEFSLRSEAVKQAFAQAFAKLDDIAFEVPGRAWFEEHNRLKPPPRRMFIRKKSTPQKPPQKPEPANVVAPIPSDARNKLSSDWATKLNNLKTIAPSVKERRRRLRSLLDELEKQSECVTYGLYLALTEELRRSYEATGTNTTPRTEWDDPELFLPMI